MRIRFYPSRLKAGLLSFLLLVVGSGAVIAESIRISGILEEDFDEVMATLDRDALLTMPVNDAIWFMDHSLDLSLHETDLFNRFLEGRDALRDLVNVEVFYKITFAVSPDVTKEYCRRIRSITGLESIKDECQEVVAGFLTRGYGERFDKSLYRPEDLDKLYPYTWSDRVISSDTIGPTSGDRLRRLAELEGNHVYRDFPALVASTMPCSHAAQQQPEIARATAEVCNGGEITQEAIDAAEFAPIMQVALASCREREDQKQCVIVMGNRAVHLGYCSRPRSLDPAVDWHSTRLFRTCLAGYAVGPLKQVAP
ncbi:hypothetical protein [Roseinatronobacter alkalisoli]|uniref:Uncharacterized protein n=1 Tax=Roseinatronobacter alkalisoli TaxID=3028235 RepID=A0ABT5TE52_9RHOB|nr:hypothetical protein [Roseinatronobacter sp. HJB301]MDD7973234.1 hypothetical protein [Roseinatronobacter sp. HJB301]